MLLDMALDVGDRVCKTVNIRTDSGYVLLCHDNDAQLQSDFEYIIKLQPTMFDVEPEEEERAHPPTAVEAAAAAAAVHTDTENNMDDDQLLSEDRDMAVSMDSSSSTALTGESDEVVEEEEFDEENQQQGRGSIGDDYIKELSSDLMEEQSDMSVDFTGENIDSDGVSLNRELIYEGRDVLTVRSILSRVFAHRAMRVALSTSIKILFLYVIGISIAWTLPFFIKK